MDQVTGEDVDWIVPRLTANAKTEKTLCVVICMSGNTSTLKNATHGEMEANAVD